MSTAAEIRTWSPTAKRIWLMDHGWLRGRNQNDWSHPDHPGSHTVAAAIRIALGGESK